MVRVTNHETAVASTTRPMVSCAICACWRRHPAHRWHRYGLPPEQNRVFALSERSTRSGGVSLFFSFRLEPAQGRTGSPARPCFPNAGSVARGLEPKPCGDI
ncbi:MAG: hypothetical protein [Circular genetic element sp.]|nr:MAG: hypothetical protein [Circular genetic element sp.]